MTEGLAEGEVEFDVVVIGAGVIGSSTAYHLTCTEAEKKVLLLEQFPVLHTRGSSIGGSRITRRAYVQSYYVQMMDEAIKIWKELQRKSGMEFYNQTGILVFAENSNKEIHDLTATLKLNNVPFEVFSGKEANRRYPYQLMLPSTYTCVLEKDGGILSAQTAVAAFQKLFVDNGGVLWDNSPVSEIIPGNITKLITSRGCISAKKVVITVGPWAQIWMKKLDLNIPLKINRSEVYYWKTEHPQHFESSVFPVFIHYSNEEKEHFYGISIHEYPGMIKAGLGGPIIDHPDNRDTDPTMEYRNKVSAFIKKHFRSVASECGIYEPCICTHTDDGNPILSYHPKYRNIVIGIGMSGHGFKLSPVFGKILCELALDMTPSYDLSPFKSINKLS